MNARTRCSGFTLVELLMTILIIGILASAVLPMVHLGQRLRQEEQLRQALRDIRDGLDAYKQAVGEGRIAIKPGESGYPKKLEDLSRGMPDAKDSKGRRIYFLRRIPRDPFNRDVSLLAEQTWGKRSYASSHEDPKEGEDVFDVYSITPGTGSNGIAYREW